MMVSVRARRGLVGLVVGAICMVMGCATAPKGPGKGEVKVEAPMKFYPSAKARSEFCGLNGYSHHVIYLIDRSGSMIDGLDAVKDKIIKSVNGLWPQHDFHVIMFADGQPLEKRPMALTPPTEAHKLAVVEFLDKIRAEGTANPINAINRAFDVMDKANANPGKIIYLLTDGSFPDNAAVLKVIRARNAGKDVTINTLLLDEKSPIAVKVMTHIARENGGQYRYVDLTK
jgi:uncharacterized protein with von Willebrand factor type A (vWA) domain